MNEEAIKILGDLIRINTTNPPGNETAAAVYLQEVLQREDIAATICEATPGRGNLVARVTGRGEKPPLILLAHLDVVAANPAQWSHDPFQAAISGSYIWGRGALDMKGMLAMETMALLQLQREGARSRELPSRDVILVAAADEEVGGIAGMEWLIKQDIPGLREAEYVINEGGEGSIRNGIPVYACQNGEKGLLWVKLKVRGTPGHASMPAGDNAVIRMAKIIQKIARYKLPLTLSLTTRGFLTELALSAGMRLPSDPETCDYSLKIFANRHFKQERSVQAMLYNTISPTIVRAGEKANVLPDCCELTLDCRLLPGETPEHFLDHLGMIITDPMVEYETLQSALPNESPVDTDLFRIMRQAVQKEDARSLVVPYLSPGSTDSRFFRNLGCTAYGFMPVIIDEGELQRMHGIDERLSLENLERGTRILTKVVKEIAG